MHVNRSLMPDPLAARYRPSMVHAVQSTSCVFAKRIGLSAISPATIAPLQLYSTRKVGKNPVQAVDTVASCCRLTADSESPGRHEMPVRGLILDPRETLADQPYSRPYS